MHLRVILGSVLLLLSSTSLWAQSSYRSQQRAAIMEELRYQSAKASGANLKRWYKGESTYGIVLSPDMQYTYRSQFDSTEHWSSAPSFDSTITSKGKALMGFYGGATGDHLLVRVSDKSMFSFSTGGIIRYQRYQFSDLTVWGVKPQVNVVSIGIPLTLEYKWGCDVNWEPSGASLAVGGGMMPGMEWGFSHNLGTSINVNIRPMLYASVGFYAGACWKVRFNYFPGTTKLYNDHKDMDAGVNTILNAQMPGSISLGIGYMGRSYDWSGGRAWRTGLRGEGRSSRRRPRADYGSMRMF